MPDDTVMYPWQAHVFVEIESTEERKAKKNKNFSTPQQQLENGHLSQV